MKIRNIMGCHDTTYKQKQWNIEEFVCKKDNNNITKPSLHYLKMKQMIFQMVISTNARLYISLVLAKYNRPQIENKAAFKTISDFTIL